MGSRMDSLEYRRRVLALLARAVDPREDSAAVLDQLWPLLGETWAPDLVRLLRNPPRVCEACNQPFRSPAPDVSTCFACREAERRAEERRRIEAEVREQLSRTGEF